MAKKIVLQENELWCQFEYHLKAQKHNNSVEFVTTEGEFVASFKKATRNSKYLPVCTVAAKFTRRFYKSEGIQLPVSLEHMRDILAERSANLKAS